MTSRDPGMRVPLPEQRQESILALIARRRWITVSELKAELRVSEATVRRDLDRLTRSHRIVRVHGGAGSRGFPASTY
jgi:DeoR/GlpR family transcriptional regulator of sugar metabolism